MQQCPKCRSIRYTYIQRTTEELAKRPNLVNARCANCLYFYVREELKYSVVVDDSAHWYIVLTDNVNLFNKYIETEQYEKIDSLVIERINLNKLSFDSYCIKG